MAWLINRQADDVVDARRLHRTRCDRSFAQQQQRGFLPSLVVDLDVVRDNSTSFAKALPDTRVFYAVKANPQPEVLDLLARQGAGFDIVSGGELLRVIAAGGDPGKTIFSGVGKTVE